MNADANTDDHEDLSDGNLFDGPPPVSGAYLPPLSALRGLGGGYQPPTQDRSAGEGVVDEPPLFHFSVRPETPTNGSLGPTPTQMSQAP